MRSADAGVRSTSRPQGLTENRSRARSKRSTQAVPRAVAGVKHPALSGVAPGSASSNPASPSILRGREVSRDGRRRRPRPGPPARRPCARSSDMRHFHCLEAVRGGPEPRRGEDRAEGAGTRRLTDGRASGYASQGGLRSGERARHRVAQRKRRGRSSQRHALAVAERLGRCAALGREQRRGALDDRGVDERGGRHRRDHRVARSAGARP